MNPDQIREFQGRNYDWLGDRLKVDGAIGPKTAWAMAIAKLDPRRQAIVARACACVGIVERQTNRGPDIDAWLERCGAPLGSPWCAAFASWCISVASLPVVREASAQRLGKSLTATRSPEPGDVMWFPTGDWTGHCGIVIGVGVSEVATVEGNQDNAVRCVRRSIPDVKFGDPANIAHYPGLLPQVPPGLVLKNVSREGTR